MGCDVRKPVFGVSKQSEITETIEISLEASPDIILYNKQSTKELIRLCGCAGWSAPLFFANPLRQVFSYMLSALSSA